MQFSQHRIVGTLKQLHEENVKPSFSANPCPCAPHQKTVSKLQQPIAACTPRATPNKPSTKLMKINVIKFNPSNPLDGLEDPDDLSSVGQPGTHLDNCKDVVINNVNTDAEAFDTTEPCLMCEQTRHTFDNCPALNSIIHL